MAFEGLTEKLNGVFKRLRGRGRLSEKDITEAMREIRMALLEADVNFKTVKEFCSKTAELCKGQDVMESLTPGQMIVKIVNGQLTELMGGSESKLEMAARPPTVVMMAGLQGAGKTTNAAKLAGYFKKHRPLLVACDVYRPAAIRQLQVLGEQLGIPVFEQGQGDPVAIAKAAVKHAAAHGNNIVFIDTAGRLHIDEALMRELRELQAAVSPTEILLTVDAMTGQDAVTTAAAFNEQLGITGVVMTKLDGDARGGAALSVRAVTGKPIKFAGMGEKLHQIEPFHPDRMASRILGMGDMLTLIEKAESALDDQKAAEIEKKLRQGRFTLTDFYDQMVQLKSMGSVQDIMGMMPRGDRQALKNAKFDERMMAKAEAIILSMTPGERENPSVLASSRKRRVAAGSGTRVEDINRLLKQYGMIRQMMKQFSPGGGRTPKFRKN